MKRIRLDTLLAFSDTMGEVTSKLIDWHVADNGRSYKGCVCIFWYRWRTLNGGWNADYWTYQKICTSCTGRRYVLAQSKISGPVKKGTCFRMAPSPIFQHGGRRVTKVGSSADTLHCIWDTRRFDLTLTLPDTPNFCPPRTDISTLHKQFLQSRRKIHHSRDGTILT